MHSQLNLHIVVDTTNMIAKVACHSLTEARHKITEYCRNPSNKYISYRILDCLVDENCLLVVCDDEHVPF
jgi:hypothetical protein